MADTTTTAPTPSRIVFDPAWSMVKQAWRWYNDHLKMLLQICLIAAIPSLLLQIVLPLTQPAATPVVNANLALVISYGLGFFVWSLFNIFWTILGTIAIYQYLRQPVTSNTAWQQFIGSHTYAVNYFSTTVLFGLIVFGGALLLIIPGIIWAVMFSLAPLISIFEKRSAVEALKRSKALIQGHWLDVFWRGLLLGLSVAAVTIVVSVVLSGIGRVSSLSMVSQLLRVLVSAVLTPLPLIMDYLIYTKLAKKV